MKSSRKSPEPLVICFLLQIPIVGFFGTFFQELLPDCAWYAFAGLLVTQGIVSTVLVFFFGPDDCWSRVALPLAVPLGSALTLVVPGESYWPVWIVATSFFMQLAFRAGM